MRTHIFGDPLAGPCPEDLDVDVDDDWLAVCVFQGFNEGTTELGQLERSSHQTYTEQQVPIPPPQLQNSEEMLKFADYLEAMSERAGAQHVRIPDPLVARLKGHIDQNSTDERLGYNFVVEFINADANEQQKRKVAEITPYTSPNTADTMAPFLVSAVRTPSWFMQFSQREFLNLLSWQGDTAWSVLFHMLSYDFVADKLLQYMLENWGLTNNARNVSGAREVLQISGGRLMRVTPAEADIGKIIWAEDMLSFSVEGQETSAFVCKEGLKVTWLRGLTELYEFEDLETTNQTGAAALRQCLRCRQPHPTFVKAIARWSLHKASRLFLAKLLEPFAAAAGDLAEQNSLQKDEAELLSYFCEFFYNYSKEEVLLVRPAEQWETMVKSGIRHGVSVAALLGAKLVRSASLGEDLRQSLARLFQSPLNAYQRDHLNATGIAALIMIDSWDESDQSHTAFLAVLTHLARQVAEEGMIDASVPRLASAILAGCFSGLQSDHLAHLQVARILADGRGFLTMQNEELEAAQAEVAFLLVNFFVLSKQMPAVNQSDAKALSINDIEQLGLTKPVLLHSHLQKLEGVDLGLPSYTLPAPASDEEEDVLLASCNSNRVLGGDGGNASREEMRQKRLAKLGGAVAGPAPQRTGAFGNQENFVSSIEVVPSPACPTPSSFILRALATPDSEGQKQVEALMLDGFTREEAEHAVSMSMEIAPSNPERSQPESERQKHVEDLVSAGLRREEAVLAVSLSMAPSQPAAARASDWQKQVGALVLDGFRREEAEWAMSISMKEVPSDVPPASPSELQQDVEALVLEGFTRADAEQGVSMSMEPPPSLWQQRVDELMADGVAREEAEWAVTFSLHAEQ